MGNNKLKHRLCVKDVEYIIAERERERERESERFRIGFNSETRVYFL